MGGRSGNGSQRTREGVEKVRERVVVGVRRRRKEKGSHGEGGWGGGSNGDCC